MLDRLWMRLGGHLERFADSTPASYMPVARGQTVCPQEGGRQG
jgi:hypothetical protein